MPGAALPWLQFSWSSPGPVSGFALPVRVNFGSADTKGQCAKRAVGGGSESPQTMVIPGKVTPCSGPIRGRSPDTGDSGHTARRQIL